ncbi:MAG: LysR family transcriptional regulator [Ruminococcaceae bacterium]|nr:LysR family transcriptional regulator [Oscillospiraceae bacterium]
MELTQIRYFLELARTEHMTKSAETLHIAQPALSQAIKRLEESVGVPLFAPKGRGIVLTEYGRYLQNKLEPVMEQIDALPGELQMMAKLSNETIHLSVLAASALVTEAVIDYKYNRRDLNFQLIQNEGQDLFDIEVTTSMFYQVNREQAKNQFVCTEKIYLAVPNNERFAGRTGITLREVKDEGFISLIGSKQFRYICDRFCRHAGVHPRIIFESDNPTAVRNMIAANLGVGFWPELSWGQVDHEKVKLLEITDPVCKRDIVVTRHYNKTDSRNVDDFFEFLRCFCEERRARTRNEK